MPRTEQLKVVRMRADKDGCLSAPALSGALMAIWKESRERPEHQVTLLLLDIDGLHQLNTVHGRDVGDRAVNAAIAELSRAAKREGWTLGRIGGDERQADGRLLNAGKLAFGSFCSFLEPLKGKAVGSQVDTSQVLEIIHQPVDYALVEILAA